MLDLSTNIVGCLIKKQPYVNTTSTEPNANNRVK